MQLRQPTAQSLFAQPSSNTVLVKDIPYFPPQGDIDDLDPLSKQLIPTTELSKFNAMVNNIDALNPFKDADKYPKEFLAHYRIKSKFSIFRKEKQHFTAYTKIGRGSVGTARLAYQHLTLQWSVIKSITITPEAALATMEKARNEYATLVSLGLAKGDIGKNESKKKVVKWNYLMQLLPGNNLGMIVNPEDPAAQKDFPDILVVHLALALVRALNALHSHPTKPILHGDLKLGNVVCDLATKKLGFVDFDRALPFLSQGHLLAEKRGNYLHHDIRAKHFFHNKTASFVYDQQSEIYGLGIMLADLFLLFEEPKFDPKVHVNLETLIAVQDVNDTYVVPKTHPKYLTNPWLRDPQVREKIYAFIQRMIGANKPTLAEAEVFFSEVKQECIKSPLCKKIQIGVLNVGAFAKLSEAEQENQLFTLQKATEVWFVDDKLQDEYTYMELRFGLQQIGITVGDKVYISNNPHECKTKLYEDLNNSELKNAYEFMDMTELKPEPEATILRI